MTTQEQLNRLMERAKFSEHEGLSRYASDLYANGYSVSEATLFGARYENATLLPLLTAQNEALKIALEALKELAPFSIATQEALESIGQILEGAVK